MLGGSIPALITTKVQKVRKKFLIVTKRPWCQTSYTLPSRITDLIVVLEEFWVHFYSFSNSLLDNWGFSLNSMKVWLILLNWISQNCQLSWNDRIHRLILQQNLLHLKLAIFFYSPVYNLDPRAVVVARLAERLLPTPEIHGSNSNIGN